MNSELPFEEESKEKNTFIRTFSANIDHELLVWHRDREDRTIESIDDTDWMIQIDNELPKEIRGQIFIPMGVHHRLIKGTRDLNIKLLKHI